MLYHTKSAVDIDTKMNTAFKLDAVKPSVVTSLSEHEIPYDI